MRRNRRGLSLPGWGRGVSVPTSTKPNPTWPKALTVSRLLVHPGGKAHPVGEFHAQDFHRIGRYATHQEGENAHPFSHAHPNSVRLWAVSGFNWNNKLLAAEYNAGDTMGGVYHTALYGQDWEASCPDDFIRYNSRA